MTANASSHPIEDVIDPDLPIVDAHHHAWEMTPPTDTSHPFMRSIARTPRYLLHEMLEDFQSGHNVVASVYVDSQAMYRADGPEELRPVGETEFVGGLAAMSASGFYGPVRACAGIVSGANLTLGDRIRPVLENHIAVGNGRYKGIRQVGTWDEDALILGPDDPDGRTYDRMPSGLYLQPAFADGMKVLGELGLTFDAALLEPQLGDLVDLAKRFPNQPMALCHTGYPLGVGRYAGTREERFPIWHDHIRQLAELPNMKIKLGGLGMSINGFASFFAEPPFSSAQLADEWRPYIESAIEAFGADRCMFESNFPVDGASASYRTLWNAFKRLASGCSADERAQLFAGTAAKHYRISL